MKIGVIISVASGRLENLRAVLDTLCLQTRGPARLVLVLDGTREDESEAVTDLVAERDMEWRTLILACEKHVPGAEQPRNVGVRYLVGEATHVWFLDSDVVVEPDCLEELERAYAAGPQDRIVVAPYDWLPPGERPPAGDMPLALHGLFNDVRWPSFEEHPPGEVLRGDLAAGLACFGGNLVWSIAEFVRVGGFWNELHHGRCEDGELGLRAVAMGVGISFAEYARGWHLWHPVNLPLILERNTRDVPIIDRRHPWLQGSDLLVVDRDGRAFDARCPCGEQVPTGRWWAHADSCDRAELPIRRD